MLIQNGRVNVALGQLMAMQGIKMHPAEVDPGVINDLLQREWKQATGGVLRAQLGGRFPTDEEQKLLNQLGAAEIPIKFDKKFDVKYKGTLLLGATLKAVTRRIQFLINQLFQSDGWAGIPEPLYLLGNNRALNQEQEMPGNVPAILQETGAAFTRNFDIDVRTPGCWPRSEIQMMQRVEDWMEFNVGNVISILASDGRAKEGTPRPANTAETIQAWLKVATPGHYLVVSSQPFCQNQKMAVERAVREAGKKGYTFDVCGPVAPSLTLSKWLDNFAKQLWEEVQLLPK